MTNRLAGESSPYLLQHSENPVDWYPWSPEAFERAREEDKPVFLSIGYSACHWCHVMERESFTDPGTAAFLNEHFVSIKVDREERPDLDHIYMQAVTALTGRGGWPLSVWLTARGEPFYGGTYFPPMPRPGMASFRQVLEGVLHGWTRLRADLDEGARNLREHLSEQSAPRSGAMTRRQLLRETSSELLASIEPLHGGWGDAPKFPPPLALGYLLARHSVSPEGAFPAGIERTLDAMAAGGIYDHLGGGFHRYSTDEAWLVPHFEKMLYDNAQLARCYLHAWQLTGKPRYRAVTEETLDYLLRRMNHPLGGFFSAEDADSEGSEGAAYTWTLKQIREALPPDDAELVARIYGATEQGNFESTNVLHLATPAEDAGPPIPDSLAQARATLFRAREQRVQPARDEKILAGWNGLALAALAEAAAALGSDRYRDTAAKAGDFLLEAFVHDGDRLVHSWKDGRASGNGFLEDYACVAEGLFALYQTTLDERPFEMARRLTDAMLTHFRRAEGGFFDTSTDHESLIFRPRSLQDSPTPCGNSMAATVLIKIAAFTGERSYREEAEETLDGAQALTRRAPVMFGQWLQADLLLDAGLAEVAIVGDLHSPAARLLLEVVRRPYRPAIALAARQAGAPSLIPILEGREPGAGARVEAWVCRDSTCSEPTSEPHILDRLLAPSDD